MTKTRDEMKRLLDEALDVCNEEKQLDGVSEEGRVRVACSLISAGSALSGMDTMAAKMGESTEAMNRLGVPRYGDIVVVKDGEHKGVVGCYDNDDDEGMIIYKGVPLASEFIEVPHELVELASEAQTSAWNREFNTDEARAEAARRIRTNTDPALQ